MTEEPIEDVKQAYALLFKENATLRADAERLDWLAANVLEVPLRPAHFISEISPDTRLKYTLPDLVSYDAIGQQISLRDAIDAALKETQ
jgi:hypothetical protein